MNRICKEILAHGTDDIVEYGCAYSFAVDYDNAPPGPEARDRTLSAVAFLISERHAIAGPLKTENGVLVVQPAANAKNNALSVLNDLTKDCKHPPDYNTGFWIQLTESGKALGERLLLELRNKDGQRD